MIYLDHAATTPILPDVLAAMMPWLRDGFGNASSLHAAGRDARRAIEHAREQVAAAVGASLGSAATGGHEVAFFSSGSEANNAVIKGLVEAHAAVPTHLVISAIEHPCLDGAARYVAETRANVELSVVAPGADGRIDPGAVAAAIRPDTRLVSVMTVNNETGAIQPVREIAAVSRELGNVAFHTDACQALGRIELGELATFADAITLCAHKAYGPKGAAALVLGPGSPPLRPLVHGGHQEGGRHAGTENTAAIVGFGAAAELATRDLEARRAQARACERALLDAAAKLGLAVVPSLPTLDDDHRAPGILNLRVAGVAADDVVIALDLDGVALSSGAACQSGMVEPSRVLRASGLKGAPLREAFRISAGLATDPDDMAAVANSLERLARARLDATS